MKTGEIVAVVVGGLVVVGVLGYVLNVHAKAVAATANANAAAAAAAARQSGSPSDMGSLLATLGGNLLSAGAAYFSDGATLFNAKQDAKSQYLV
jgi:hypothetical protein